MLTHLIDGNGCTWMSCWKLGSKVRISGFITSRNTPFVSVGEITHLLTSDPNFLGHPSISWWTMFFPTSAAWLYVCVALGPA